PRIERASATPARTSVARESRPGHAGRVGAAIVRRENFDIDVPLPPVQHVLDAEIGKSDAIIEVGQLVFARPLGDLARVPIGTAVAVRTTAVVFLQPFLILALQLGVEDDATDVAALLAKMLLFA